MISLIGRRILELLDKQDLTQREFSKRVGVTEVTISRYINGERIPHPEIVIKMAEILHTSTDYLFGQTNDQKPIIEETPEEIAEIFNFIRQKSKEMTPEERKQLTRGIKAFIRASEEDK